MPRACCCIVTGREGKGPHWNERLQHGAWGCWRGEPKYFSWLYFRHGEALHRANTSRPFPQCPKVETKCQLYAWKDTEKNNWGKRTTLRTVSKQSICCYLVGMPLEQNIPLCLCTNCRKTHRKRSMRRNSTQRKETCMNWHKPINAGLPDKMLD